MKKGIKIFIITFFILLIIVSFAFIYKKKEREELRIESEKIIQEEKEKLDNEIAREFVDYAKLYDEPVVKMVREVLDAYLEEDWEWFEENAAEPSVIIDAGGEWENWEMGLDSFDKSYYESKFVVYRYNEDNLNRASPMIFTVDLLFVDNPDRLFRMNFVKNDTTENKLKAFFFMAEPKVDEGYTKEFMEKYSVFFELEEYQM